MGKKPLNSYEMKIASDFIKRITPLPDMELEVLKAIWESRIIPTCTLNLLVFDISIPKIVSSECWPKIFLIKRNDFYMPDCWHYPGGYLGAGEKINNAIQRIAKRETGVMVKNVYLAFVTAMPNFSRDPQISIHFFCCPEGKPNNKNAQFFALNKLPDNLPEHQVMALEKVRQIIEFMKLLRNRGLFKSYLEINKVQEFLGSK